MTFKDEIIDKLKEYFGSDQKRIKHALQVTEYAEKLVSISQGKNIDPEIIIYSAILHDIGIKNAEEKYGSSAPKYQEIEGPPVARKLLNSFPIEQEIIDEICDIIGNHHSPGNINTYNFKLLYDADWLVNLPDEYDLAGKPRQKILSIIDKLYLTDSGKEMAEELFSSGR